MSPDNSVKPCRKTKYLKMVGSEKCIWQDKTQAEKRMDQEDLADQCDRFKPSLWVTCLFWLSLLGLLSLGTLLN